MSPLRVDPAALALLAVQCRHWADSIAEPPDSTGSGSTPAIAAAVATVHTRLRTVAEDLAGRMHATAFALDEAARRHGAADQESAAVLGDAPAAR